MKTFKLNVEMGTSYSKGNHHFKTFKLCIFFFHKSIFKLLILVKVKIATTLTCFEFMTFRSIIHCAALLDKIFEKKMIWRRAFDRKYDTAKNCEHISINDIQISFDNVTWLIHAFYTLQLGKQKWKTIS